MNFDQYVLSYEIEVRPYPPNAAASSRFGLVPGSFLRAPVAGDFIQFASDTEVRELLVRRVVHTSSGGAPRLIIEVDFSGLF